MRKISLGRIGRRVRKNPRRRRSKISYYQRQLQRRNRPSAMTMHRRRVAKRKAKKARVNPTTHRAKFIVSVRHGGEKDWRKNFHQIAAFMSKVQALDYARALARMNKRATIKVEAKR